MLDLGGARTVCIKYELCEHDFLSLVDYPVAYNFTSDFTLVINT